ncbi:MAG: mandelate racemase/muconate lactonizing enzyme family protein [Pseudomonadota bacterium]
MNITQVDIRSVELPTKGGRFRRGGNYYAPNNVTTLVEVHTDVGLTGLGEHCPIGTHYGSGWHGAALDGCAEIARLSLGEDPLQPERLNRKWDRLFASDHYAKSAIDMALWDIISQHAVRPVSNMLGGTYPDAVPLYRSIHVFENEGSTHETYVSQCKDYRSAGYRNFQLKCGETADIEIKRIEAICDELQSNEELICDANGTWPLATATRICQASRDAPIILEQPCAKLEDCAALRRLSPLRMKLDESVKSSVDLVRTWQTVGMDAVSIRVGRVGGLTKARRMRELAIDLGISVVADDLWGAEIVSASLAHFAQSTDRKFLLNSTDLTDYVTQSVAAGFPDGIGGTLRAVSEPGLGLSLTDDIRNLPAETISEAQS